MLKKMLFTVIIFIVLAGGLTYGAKSWIKSLIPEKAHFIALKKSQVSNLPY